MTRGEAWAALALFALAAWPLLIVDCPPLQDLPNHLASAEVMRHPADWPELRVNGLLRTNTALYAWLYAAGGPLGLAGAAKVFVAATLGVTAFALVRVATAFGGPRAAVPAALVGWPLVHNWFVSTGMLNYALAAPLALLVALALRARRRAVAACLAAGVWLVHAFPILVVGGLAALWAATRPTWRARREAARDALLPLAPAFALAVGSSLVQAGEGAGPMTGFVAQTSRVAGWELFYEAWAEHTLGFTKLSATSLVPVLVLAWLLATRAREDRHLFGAAGVLALLVGYVIVPKATSNWFYVNTRLLPFVYAAAVARVPERFPRWLTGLLGASAVLYSAAMGIDYVRLARDEAELTAGVEVVPPRARLLPLLFRQKATSENTRSILHAWGRYVVARHASAPLLFAHSRAFPVTYVEPPPPRWNHLVLEGFAPSMRDPDWMCDHLREAGIVLGDCRAAWRAAWGAFWTDAATRFDHVLLWDASAEVLAELPEGWQTTFVGGRLRVLARVQPPAAASAGAPSAPPSPPASGSAPASGPPASGATASGAPASGAPVPASSSGSSSAVTRK